MGLKDRLAQAKPRTAIHQLRIEDDSAARRELAEAQAGDDEERITAARAALDACYEPLHLTAMPLPEWDDLVSQHQPPEGMRKLGRWCDPVTFLPAALVICAVDSDVDEATWHDYASKGPMAPGEVNALLDDLLMVHDRSPDLAVPKDSIQIRS